jgi:hypothetical protein
MKNKLEDVKLNPDLRDEVKDAAERVEKSFNASKAAVSDTLAEGKASAGQLLNRGMDAAESCLDDVTYEIRRSPRAAVAMAFGAGAIAGALFGLMAPRSGKKRVGG